MKVMKQVNQIVTDSKGPVPAAPRRSAKSTKDIPPVHYGQVQIHSTIISELEKPTRYRQILYVPCYQSAETDNPGILYCKYYYFLVCH